jgi:hypothetical protein
MEETKTLQSMLQIEQRIYTIRGLQVMLDSDLAELYGVPTGRFNEQVKRNLERFPEDFRFRISITEWENLLSHFAIASWGGRRSAPYVFTEQGVAGLSGILKSDTAVRVHIDIMRAFVQMRQEFQQYGHLLRRVGSLEAHKTESEKKFQQIFQALEGSGKLPETGIFFEGQVFDAWMFVSDLIRSAGTSIVLIDNYLDDTVLKLLAKRKSGVAITLFTRKVTPQLSIESDKFNRQYGGLEIRQLSNCHDRFLIIDETSLYHIGASLKDLGKNWFAFSKIDTLLPSLQVRLKESKSR